MRSGIVRFVLLAAMMLRPTAGIGFETDQYNLPPVALADIGNEVSEYTEENIRRATARLNGEISDLRICLEGEGVRNKCDSREKTISRLGYLRSDEAIASEVYRLLGSGFIATSKSGTWMDTHKFRGEPARYKTDYRSSIFQIVPTNYLTISPTVNMFGTQLGTDKIAHFFQQGYTYYRIYKKSLAKGSSSDEAVLKAINWGKLSEQTFYGTLVSGVFSNADLYANYAGMKFYRGLTEPVRIGQAIRPPVLLVENGVWIFNKKIDLHELLIKPFVTRHMNEAMNPSIFTVVLRASIRKIVKKRSCPQWRKLYPNLSKSDLLTESEALALWYGEDYGFRSSEKFVTIANTCF